MLNERSALASAAVPPQPVPKHVEAMETALRLLHATGDALAASPASPVDLRPVAASVERGIVAVLDAFDARRDPPAAVRHAVAAVDEAIACLAGDASAADDADPLPGWLDRARGWLLVAEEQLARIGSIVAPARPILVSDGVPRAFRLDRPTIAPRFPVADPLPPPAPARRDEGDAAVGVDRIAATREKARAVRDAAAERRAERARRRAPVDGEGEEAPPPGFVRGAAAALTHDAFVARRTRELFEEVTTCGLQRTGQLGELWRDVESIDRRMLRALDAVAGLGGRAVSALEQLLVDAPAKDPARGFALAFLLGSFEGRDALAAIERGARWLDPSADDVRHAVAGGLKLAPHPDLGPFLRRWLADEDPGLRVIAVDVLGHRQLATDDDLRRALADRDPRVVASAMRWAALGAAPLRVLARAAVEAHRSASDPILVEATAWANVLGGFAAAADSIEALLRGPHAGVAWIPLAIGGELAHARRLLDEVEREPTAAAVEAVGYAGPGEALPVLVALLSDPRVGPEVRQVTAFALQRITGVEVFDDVDVPPEALDAPEPADPPNVPPEPRSLARMVSDPRDLPGEGAPDRMRLPSTQALVWEDVLAREGHRYVAGRRHRRGLPYSPDVTLAELDRHALTPRERRILVAELVIRTGEVVPLDPDDLVPVQEAAIAAWTPIAHRASSMPGGWGRPTRR